MNVEIILTLTLFCLLTMAALWAVCLRIKNASIVDAVWAGLFSVAALFCVAVLPGHAPRRLLLGAMVCLWSWRLCLHLALRIKKHFPQEDRRYETFKQKWSGLQSGRFFAFRRVFISSV